MSGSSRICALRVPESFGPRCRSFGSFVVHLQRENLNKIVVVVVDRDIEWVARGIQKQYRELRDHSEIPMFQHRDTSLGIFTRRPEGLLILSRGWC